MWSVSTRWGDAVRGAHTLVSKAVHRNLVTGVATVLPIVDGSITEDSTAQVRRSLNLTVPAQQSTWDLLDTPGGEITVTQGIRYIDASVESIPMGVFVVDTDQIGYGPGDTISLTCPDRWLKVQRNKFGTSRASVASNTAWQEIKRLVEACWGGAYPFPGWSQLDTSATTKVGYLLWDDGERENAITQLAVDNSLEVFFDRAGKAVLRKVPALSNTASPVWRVDASSTGVMIGANRSRDRSRTRNAVILTSSASDVVFAPVEVKNTTTGDPLNITGPLGYVPYYYSSPTLRNSTQAAAAGKTMLQRQLGTAQQLTLEAVGNPALDAEDVILVVLPQIDRNTPRPVELHMLDSVTHPLAPAGTQSLTTRSTRPDTDGS